MKSGTSCAKANICPSLPLPPTFSYLTRKSEYGFGSLQGKYGLCCQGLEHTRGSAAPSLAPLCITPWVFLYFVALSCWSLPCWCGLLAWPWTWFVTVELHDRHVAVAQKYLLSLVLLCPTYSGTAGLHPCWSGHQSSLPHCHHWPLLMFYLMEQPNLAVVFCLLFFFLLRFLYL